MSDTQDTQKGQVIRSAAEVYEEFFVPALFGEWVGPMSEAAGLAPGQAVLDVACGTGVLAREAYDRTQPGGSVTGLDRNEGMLAVAQASSSAIEWRHGVAESLPFENARFDAVVSQFGLMFFDDRVASLKEMWRVLRPGGRLAVAVWDSLEHSPGYASVTALLHRLFGERVANEMRAPFVLGDTEALRSLFHEAGIGDVTIATHDGTARFPSIEAWVHTDVRGWTLAGMIDDEQYQTLLAAAQKELTPFVQSDGTVAVLSPAHIATAQRA